MARKRKTLSLVVGIALGALLSALLKREGDPCGEYAPRRPFADDVGASEGGARDLLFVGVMTAAQYLDTRARAVYETWGRRVPGKIAFFSSERSRSRRVPLVPLIGVDDVYPPQKKSFTMLKYMHDHYLDRFEWFMRADDDVYVRTDRLEALLRSVDSSKPWFIGQTGRGNSEEFGLLSLESDENFCMGGPGIILSRETLRKLGPHIEECLENLYTAHEDVELGRCVRRSAGISCTWSYEASDFTFSQMQMILYHNQSGEAAFSGDLKQKAVHRAITLHPVKKPPLMYRLHKYVKGLSIRSKKQECIKLHRDMAFSYAEMGENLRHLEEDFQYELSPHVEDRYFGEGNILGKPAGLNRYKPKSLEEVIDWEFISKSLYSYKDLNPKRRYGSSVKEGLDDVVREVMEIINQFSKQRGRVIDFKEIFYGYFRLDPVHGVDLILDLLLVYKKYRGHKMTVPVRRHAYIQLTFNGLEIREIGAEESPTSEVDSALHKKLIKHVISKFSENMPTLFTRPSEEDQQINFVLPLSGRHDTFRRFMTHFAHECLDTKENIKLIVILYSDERNNESPANSRHGEDAPNDLERTLNLLNDYTAKYSYDNIIVKIVNETFARGKALQHGIDLIASDDLMFFIDVDMVFSSDFLLRVRRNVVKGTSVYFPIVFSMYNPVLYRESYKDNDISLNNFEPDEDLGAWRQFGFGLCGLYKQDYVLLGGFNTSISGWGLEDVNLFDKAVKSNLTIVRSVDRGLVHVWHPVRCDPNLEGLQLGMCKGTQASMLGSLRTLQKYYKEHVHRYVGGHLVNNALSKG